jgi:hypothetical protein
LDNRLEMGFYKCRLSLNGGVMGRNNRIIRIVGFMDLRKEVGRGGLVIRNMEEGDILGGKTVSVFRRKIRRAWLQV